MKRRLLLLAIATTIGAWLGGFHEWAHPHTAQATPTCTITQQFASTQAVDNQPPPNTWTVLVGPTLTASCTTKWYVTFTAQCKTGHTAYQQCITNQLCPFASVCTPNTLGWGAGTTHSYDEPSGTPAGFTGYWDNGDGFTQAGSVCDYIWRIREAFKNGNDNTIIATAFSPEGGCAP